ALRGQVGPAREVSPGLIWITILLAGTLGLNRSFASERENSSLDALLMAPVERWAIYLGKVIAISLFVFGLEIITAFFFFIFFNQPYLLPQVLGVLFLGTIGFVAAGVLVTAMTIQTRSRDVLLPVLLLPLVLPAVLAAGFVTGTFINDGDYTWNTVGFPISLIVLYDTLMLLAGLLGFRFVVEE
ncbi:MAG: heme exporter protein CcmB, partial [Chloroflexota bacterium]